MAYYTYKQVRDLLPQHIIEKQGPNYEGDPGYDGDQWTAAADYITELKESVAAKDRDLADANHALLLANSNADAFKRVAEQRQGEIERLKTALRVAISDIESWHEALDEAAGLPPEASVLPALRSVLTAADRQLTETERFNRAYERNALLRGQYDPDDKRLTLPAGSGG